MAKEEADYILEHLDEYPAIKPEPKNTSKNILAIARRLLHIHQRRETIGIRSPQWANSVFYDAELSDNVDPLAGNFKGCGNNRLDNIVEEDGAVFLMLTAYMAMNGLLVTAACVISFFSRKNEVPDFH